MRLSEDSEDVITVDILKKKYRKLSFEMHPDYNKNQNATEMFLKLTAAYDYLIKLVPFSVKQVTTSYDKDLQDLQDLINMMKQRSERAKKEQEETRKRMQKTWEDAAGKTKTQYQNQNQNKRQKYWEGKQKTYSNEPIWRTSAKGNEYVRKNNLTYIIFKNGNKFKYCIKNSDTGDTTWRNDMFDTIDEAKDFIKRTHLQN